MADLTANIDFDLLLDFTQNKIILTDTGDYPVGVEETLTGIVKITQPDGISTQPPSTPDIVWNGTDLTKATKELRLTVQGKPQQGTYTVAYQIFDGVNYTTKTEQFQLAYTKPTQKIDENFDVFTPELQVADVTDYAVSGFTNAAPTRLWNAQIGTPPIDTVTGTGASLDLGIGGTYYDAKYTISLTAVVLYTHTTYTYLTVKDQFATQLITQANTPPSTDDLLEYVDEIKAKVDAQAPCGDECCDGQCDYILAFTLYRHIRDRICKHNTVGLEDYIQQLLNIYYGYVKTYVNTNLPILPYATGDCGEGGGGSTVLQLEYRVGAVGAPVDGQSTFVIAAIANHDIVLFIGSIIQSKMDNGYGVSYSKPNASDTITLTGQTWSNGTIVQILVL